MQLSVIIVLFAVILEFVEFSETYKIIRPYKFYNRHGWRPPSVWSPFPKSRKHYHSKKIQQPKYHSYKPDYHRYAPHYEDSDIFHGDKPYVIIIQFPQKKETEGNRKEQKKYHSHQRQHIIDSPRDIDYIDDDDDDDDELKVYEFDDKGVQIKINH